MLTLPARVHSGQMPVPTAPALVWIKGIAILLLQFCSGNISSHLAVIFLQELAVGSFTGAASHGINIIMFSVGYLHGY